MSTSQFQDVDVKVGEEVRPVRARDVDDELHEFVPDVGRRRFVVVRQEVLKRRPEEDGFIFSGAPGCLIVQCIPALDMPTIILHAQ